MTAQPAGARGTAYNAAVVVGPPATPEEEAAIAEQVAAEERAAAERREAKLRAKGNG